MTPDESYMFANAALSSIIILPVLILSRSYLFQSHNRNHAAFDGIQCLKLAYSLFLISLVLTVAADAVYIAMVRGDDGFGSLLKASNYLSLISGFFEQLATIYTLGAMLEIGLDLLYMQKTVRGYSGEFKDNFRENAHTTWASIGDNSDQRDHKRMARLAATVVGLFLLVLAVAVLCKACDGYALYNQGSLNGSETGVEANVDGLDFAVIVDRYIAAIHTARELTASFDFCVWILVLLLMGLVCSIVNQARLEINNSSLNATFLLLAATLLCLARFTWHLFYNIMWLLPSSSSGAPIWFDAVDPVLNAWLFFVALVLLHAVVTSPICGP